MVVDLTDAYIKEKVDKLKEQGKIFSNGLLTKTINRKLDIMVYLIYIWKLNKGRFPFISNVKLSTKRLQKLYKKFENMTIKQIVDISNDKLSVEGLKFKGLEAQPNFTNDISFENKEKETELKADKLSFSTTGKTETKADKNTKTNIEDSKPTIVIRPKIKFITDGYSIPKDSVTIKFSDAKII
jgi:hypothetical protein